jgi:cell division protein FtsQ
MPKQKSKRSRFFSGTGKFALALITFYLLYFAVNKIIDAQHGGENNYSRSEIEISGNSLVPEHTILQICGYSHDTEDKPIKIDPDDVARKLMGLYYVRGVSITRRLPRKLNITIEERTPVAFIYGRGLNLIDQPGYLMPVPETGKPWDLPVITGITEKLGELGKPSTAGETYIALEILKYLETVNPLLYAMVSQIDMSKEKYISLYLIKGGTAIKIGRVTYQKELYVLKNYLINYVDWVDLDDIEYIDLRFQDQLIVKYRS